MTQPKVRLLVYCGAYGGTDPLYATMVESLADTMVRHSIGLVYGGGGIGLMGVLARRICSSGGYVKGIIPSFLTEVEGHNDPQILASSLVHVCNTMHERKQLMLDECDAVLALPGGFGTLDELFEAITWKQLGLHRKPIAVYNANNYYTHLQAHIELMHDTGFISSETAALAYVGNSLDDIFGYLFGIQLAV